MDLIDNFGFWVTLGLAIVAAAVAAILLRHEGRPRSIIVAVLLVSLLQAGWTLVSNKLSDNLADKRDAKISELKQLLATAEKSRDRIGQQSQKDISNIQAKLDAAEKNTFYQSKKIGELKQEIYELGAKNLVLTKEVTRLNSTISGQNLLIEQTRNLAAESTRLLEKEQETRFRCSHILGDENFRRANGC